MSPSLVLAAPGGPARQHGPSGRDGIGRVRLALEASALRSGRSTLNHLDLFTTQVAGQAVAPGSGRLHPDTVNLAERFEPVEQRGVAGKGGRERLGAKQRPVAESSAAVTCTSAWVSTPPVTRRGSAVTMVPVLPGRCDGCEGPLQEADRTAKSLRQQAPMRSRNRTSNPSAVVPREGPTVHQQDTVGQSRTRVRLNSGTTTRESPPRRSGPA
jgi:hypothetical protein